MSNFWLKKINDFLTINQRSTDTKYQLTYKYIEFFSHICSWKVYKK